MNSPDSTSSMGLSAAPNEVRRFIVENQPVRGYWVDLDSAWQALRAHQHYPRDVQDLLGEAVSASVLLAATLKFEGTLTLQLEGKGDVRLLVAQCTNDYRVRGVVRMSDDGVLESDEPDDSFGEDDAVGDEGGGQAELSGIFDLGARVDDGSDPFAVLPRAAEAFSAASFRRLVGESGRVIVTIEGGDKGMRYQGIVPLNGDSLSECLEAYFASSEQLPTRVRLAADNGRAVGLLVQKLPEPGGVEAEEGSASALAWEDAERGIAAVRPFELVGASLQSLLAQRFGSQDLRVFKGAPVEFACRCSQARVAGLLRAMGADEVRDVLREQGAVEVTCEFCQRPYKFDALAVEQLFAPGATPEGSQSLH